MAHLKDLASALLLAATPGLALAYQDAPAGLGGDSSPTVNEANPPARATQDPSSRPAGTTTTTTTTRPAQEPDAAAPAAGVQAIGATPAPYSDRLFVSAALEAGMAEVAVSQLALQKASREEVKQFARQMLEDHTRANRRLMELARNARGGGEAGPAGDAGAGTGAAAGASDGYQAPASAGGTTAPGDSAPSGADANRDPGGARTTTSSDATGGRNTAASATAGTGDANRDEAIGQARFEAQDPAAGQGQTGIGRRGGVGRGGMAAMQGRGGGGLLGAGHRAELSILASKQGAEFDECYVKQQVAAHMCAVALFEAQSEMGQDEQLRSFATETLPKLQQHLEMAKGLCEQGEGQGQAHGQAGAHDHHAAKPDPGAADAGSTPAAAGGSRKTEDDGR